MGAAGFLHFRTMPACDAYVASLAAIRNASKRVKITHAGGRPRKKPPNDPIMDRILNLR